MAVNSSLAALMRVIDECREKIPEGEYLVAMNALGTLHREDEVNQRALAEIEANKRLGEQAIHAQKEAIDMIRRAMAEIEETQCARKRANTEMKETLRAREEAVESNRRLLAELQATICAKEEAIRLRNEMAEIVASRRAETAGGRVQVQGVPFKGTREDAPPVEEPSSKKKTTSSKKRRD